jgi:PIN domain nuclease of toxin-antitoxin system
VRLLLDSHTLLWAAEKNSKLSANAEAELVNPANERLLSPAAYWEIAIKVSIGKLTLAEPFETFLDRANQDLILTALPIQPRHAAMLTTLPMHHRDPFDRMLIAQALVEQVPIVSADAWIDAYGVKRIW